MTAKSRPSPFFFFILTFSTVSTGCHPSAPTYQAPALVDETDASLSVEHDGGRFRLDSGRSRDNLDAAARNSNPASTHWCEDLRSCCETFPRSMIDKCRMAVSDRDETTCQELLQTPVGEVLCGQGPNIDKPVQTDASNDATTASRLDGGQGRSDTGRPRTDAGQNRRDSGGIRIDAGQLAPDAFTRTDGGRPHNDGGQPSQMDAALMNPVCQEFADCCPQLPAGTRQAMCYQVSERDWPRDCFRELRRAQSMGHCLRTDAGP